VCYWTNSDTWCTQVLAYLACGHLRSGYACPGLGAMGPGETVALLLHLLKNCPDVLDAEAREDTAMVSRCAAHAVVVE
jgi:hypothetical protein